jgi:hypothetical protein
MLIWVQKYKKFPLRPQVKEKKCSQGYIDTKNRRTRKIPDAPL